MGGYWETRASSETPNRTSGVGQRQDARSAFVEGRGAQDQVAVGQALGAGQVDGFAGQVRCGEGAFHGSRHVLRVDGLLQGGAAAHQGQRPAALRGPPSPGHVATATLPDDVHPHALQGTPRNRLASRGHILTSADPAAAGAALARAQSATAAAAVFCQCCSAGSLRPYVTWA